MKRRFFIIGLLVLIISLLPVMNSIAQSCGTCNWYGTNFSVCCNVTSGWGWENNKSCISRNDCVAAGQTCTGCSGGTTTTSTGGGTTTSTSGGGSNTIVVRARGTSGSEQIRVEVNGSTIQTFTLSTSLSNYTASTNNSGAINVRFINDGTNKDAFVDYIDVNGQRRQAENQGTNTAVYQNGACGGSNSEWMHCNGYIAFGNVSGGSTTTTSVYGTTPAPTTPPGSTTTTSSGGGGNTYITQTIRVNGGTYDGYGTTIHASGMGDGSQDEDQDPIFRLENATLKNVRIAAPGCDGIHCYGNCRLENVVWEDIGEDALTVKGQGTVTISGGSAQNATDKVFQLNASCTFTVQNFSCSNFGCFIRQNGGTDFSCTIYINSCTLSNGSYIGRTDSPSTRIYYRNISASNVSTWWRVPNSSQVQTY